MKRRLILSISILGGILGVLLIGLLVVNAQTTIPPIELVGQIPSEGENAIQFVEAIQGLDNSPNDLLIATRGQGADCGGGTPISIWKMTLDSSTGNMTNVRHIQYLSSIQDTRKSLFESSDGTLFTGSGWCGYKPPYYSIDNGETWQTADAGAVYPPNSTFSFVEFNGDVYAGTGYEPYNGQVYRWLGNGGTNYWELVLDIPPPRSIVNSMEVYQNRLFVSSVIYWWDESGCESSVPVYVSADGSTFNATTGIPPCYTVKDIVTVGNQLVAVAYNYADSTEAFMYYWNNETQEWEETAPYPLPANSFRMIAYKGVLYVGGDPAGGEFYRSMDMGQTWEQIATLGDIGIYGWTVHNDVLYIGTHSDANNTAYIYRIRPRALSLTNDSPTLLGQSTTLTATLTSSDNASYIWDLGDGATAGGMVVTHTYPAIGNYTVVVTASDNVGIITATTNVTITSPPPAPDFVAYPQVGIAPLSVMFVNHTHGLATRYLWDLGDGQMSTLMNPIYTYHTAGIYTVTLTAFGPGGSNTTIKSNYIQVLSCPATHALRKSPTPPGWTSEAGLEALRKLRDDVMAQSDVGQHYTSLYYTHAGEITRLLSQEPGLSLQVGKLLWRYLPDIQTMTVLEAASSGEAKPQVIDAAIITEATSILDEVELQASPELREWIEWERPRLKEYTGLTIAQAWEKVQAGPLPLESKRIYLPLISKEAGE